MKFKPLKRAATFLAAGVIAGGALVAFPGTASAHAIVCEITPEQPKRYSNKSGTVHNVGGYVQSKCNFGPDERYMVAQLQILDYGSWRDYGNPTETRSKAANVRLYDGAGCKTGTFQYRMKVEHTARHHNTGITNKVGSPVTITC